MSSEDWVHHEAEWEAHKPLIRRLYLEEGKTVLSIMKIMRTDYRFKATKDMYKRRLSKWKFDKHVRERDALAIMRKSRERAATGKLSIFRKGDSIIQLNNVEKHLKRKFLSERKLLEAIANDSPPPNGLECLTPPSIPFLLEMPANIAVPGMLLTKIRDYFRASFGSGVWIKGGEGLDCCSIRAGGSDMNGLKLLFSRHDLACQLFDRGSFDEAGKVLISASANLKSLVLAEHPRTLSALFDLSLYLARQRRSEVSTILLRQVAALAIAMLSPQHPLRIICGSILDIEPGDFKTCLDVVWRCTLDQFEDHLGPLHYSTIRCRLEYIQMAVALNDVDQAEIKIRDLLGKCQPTLGISDSRTLKLLDTLAETLMDQGKYSEMKEIGRTIVDGARIFADSDEDRFIDLSCSGLFIVARAQFMTHNPEQALSNLTKAIELCSSYRGIEHPLSLKYLVHLEDWSSKANNGLINAAAQQRRLDGMARLDDMV